MFFYPPQQTLRSIPTIRCVRYIANTSGPRQSSVVRIRLPDLGFAVYHQSNPRIGANELTVYHYLLLQAWLPYYELALRHSVCPQDFPKARLQRKRRYSWKNWYTNPCRAIQITHNTHHTKERNTMNATHNSISIPPRDLTNWRQTLEEPSLIPLVVCSDVTSPRSAADLPYCVLFAFTKVINKLVKFPAQPQRNFIRAWQLQSKLNMISRPNLRSMRWWRRCSVPETGGRI